MLYIKKLVSKLGLVLPIGIAYGHQGVWVVTQLIKFVILLSADNGNSLPLVYSHRINVVLNKAQEIYQIFPYGKARQCGMVHIKRKIIFSAAMLPFCILV